MTRVVEAVIINAAEAEWAAIAGADRLELCRSIELGGLTPLSEVLTETRRVATRPIVAMLRPRSGGFLYDETEIVRMEEDAEMMGALGAQAIAFGAIDTRHRLDERASRRILKRLGGAAGVLHRAFDATRAPLEALEQAIDLGFSRILTSGGRGTALQGADTIQRLIDQAAGRIDVVAAGAIRAENVSTVIERTGCAQIHLAPRTPDHPSALDRDVLEATVRAARQTWRMG